MKKKTKFIVLLLLMVFLLVASNASALAASNYEKQAKATVTSFFKSVKKYDTSKIKKCFVNPKKVKLFESKKYMKKFFKSTNKELDYKIVSVKANKKEATVKVYCEYYNAFDIFQCSFSDVVDYMLDHPKASSSSIDKYQYNRTLKLRNMFDKSFGGGFDFKTISLKLKRVGKSWKIISYTKALNNVIHCNYQYAYDDFF